MSGAFGRGARWWRAGLVVAAGAGAVLLATVDPATSDLYPPCVFHALTGLNCPGCGTARALHHLLHGDVAAALRFNPLVVCLLPYFAVVAARLAGLVRESPARDLARPVWTWLLAAVVLGFGLLRNVPGFPGLVS